MNINLSTELTKQLRRCQSLADDAEEDTDSPLSQRATALSAMNNLLKELTRTQLEVINMSRLQVLEQTLIDMLPEFLDQGQVQEFLDEYEKRLAIAEQREIPETEEEPG